MAALQFAVVLVMMVAWLPSIICACKRMVAPMLVAAAIAAPVSIFGMFMLRGSSMFTEALKL